MQRASNVPTGNIDTFSSKGNKGRAYLDFIEQLKGALTQQNVNHGGIRLTKTDGKVTKVILESGTTQVPFIYRNSDLYIIGFLLSNGSTQEFWVDEEVFRGLRLTNDKLPRGHAWADVIGANTAIKSLSVPLSYNNILGGNTVKINKMGDSLKKLKDVTDRNKRMGVVQTHLAPFVVAFSEALRFTVVARLVSKAFVKDDGEIDMSTNVLQLTGVGHPDKRKSSIYDIKWLTLNWGKLSDKVKTCYVDNISTGPLRYCDASLGLERNQLNQLLSIASSGSFRAGRGKRGIHAYFEQTVPPQVMDTLNFNQISNDSTSSSKELLNPNREVDLVGGLQLITLGILYASGRKLRLLTYEPQMDFLEAQAVATELVQRINCVTDLDLGFERNIYMQKELAAELARGGNVVGRMAALIEEQFANRTDKAELVAAAEEAVMNEIAGGSSSDELMLSGRKCFPELKNQQ